MNRGDLYNELVRYVRKKFASRPNIAEDNEEMRQFIEMCFDPKSKVNVKLKDTLYRMMMEDEKNDKI